MNEHTATGTQPRTILQRLWKATEVERWGFKEWWTNGPGGELRFIAWGLGLLVLPFIIIGCLIFAAVSIFR